MTEKLSPVNNPASLSEYNEEIFSAIKKKKSLQDT